MCACLHAGNRLAELRCHADYCGLDASIIYCRVVGTPLYAHSSFECIGAAGGTQHLSPSIQLKFIHVGVAQHHNVGGCDMDAMRWYTVN